MTLADSLFTCGSVLLGFKEALQQQEGLATSNCGPARRMAKILDDATVQLAFYRQRSRRAMTLNAFVRPWKRTNEQAGLA